MPNYSKNNIILVQYPFSNLSSSKIRPAVVISAPHVSQDILITPLTSKTGVLLEGEFVLLLLGDKRLDSDTAYALSQIIKATYRYLLE
ncbi:hypothetical protein [Nostoc sp.]|uniref:hypothetical protein n=1 Tax=Nostoc sp. TaxID=1180 RepID=UPI002FF9ED56